MHSAFLDSVFLTYVAEAEDALFILFSQKVVSFFFTRLQLLIEDVQLHITFSQYFCCLHGKVHLSRTKGGGAVTADLQGGAN